MTYSFQNLKTISKQDIPANMRLCRIIAKGGKVGNKVIESQGVFLPIVSVNTVQALLADKVGAEFLCNAVASVQDGLARNRLGAGNLSVYDNHIDLASMLIAMAVENETQRFSKESIKVWFDSVLRNPLSDAIRSKMAGVSDSMVEKLLGNYLESFQVLAQRAPSMKAETKAGLLRALDFVPVDHESVTALEIVRRLNVVEEATAMLAAL